MTPTAEGVESELFRRLRAVPAPAPVLSRADKEKLTTRQREILDELSIIFYDGFANRTMADLASQLGCSLRTLYGIARSRDELVMTVVDRNLWQSGRIAMEAITPEMTPLAALRAYLVAANHAVEGTTEAFARDTAATPNWSGLGLAHTHYLTAITAALLQLAQEEGEIGDVDIAASAYVFAGLGRWFAEPAMIPKIRATPTAAANEVLDLLLAGIQSSLG